MQDAEVRSIEEAFAALRPLLDRRPDTADADGSFCRLADTEDGGVFLAWFAGASEWERHGAGDEVVLVLEGATKLVLLRGGREVEHALRGGELLVVPRGTWHRFEAPEPVRILTVTPQPTDHSVERPA